MYDTSFYNQPVWYLTFGLFGNLSNSNRLYSIFVRAEGKEDVSNRRNLQ